MIRKTIKIAALSLILLFAIFWVWYEYTYAMDTVIPFEINDPHLQTKVLIASQGSRFKDSLVQSIITHYQHDSIYFKVIDVYTLFTVTIKKWDAVVIINSWEYGSPPKNVKKFIKNHPNQLDKLIILSTVGSSNIALKDVDVISGESIMEKTPKYSGIVIEKLNKLIQ
ncbi:hypothetical protein J8281_04785 [Aquimarina sp. U1-2]|uniref:hypothetical protein n=1 Tax=Aquimarina sp. U1-2 TaxID=2823141 RepID=UPI001AECD8BF|nr:hypothetical protein [Aquimarina sp. U1-2]MBP2831496.1 hypothetical protein [Aquimarina sp. U1-2]